MVELTEDERALLHAEAKEKWAHARRCAARCLAPNRPESVKANAANWQRTASLWDSIAAKTKK